MVKLPNIYESKYAKYYILIPLVMLAFGLYFSTHIVLDSSLSGGVSVIMQTNATSINQQTLATEIASQLHSPNPSIQVSPGGLQVTLSLNQSIANAEQSLIGLYAYSANYSASQYNITGLTIALNNSKGNQTLISQLNSEQQISTASIAGARSSLNTELAQLQPFIGTKTYNASVASNPDLMATFGQNAYTNASNAYETSVLAGLHKLVPFTTYSYQQLTPTLGSYFLGQLIDVIIVAFILISIVVFAIFRSPVPAFAVVFGAANDMIVALGAMALFGIPLGLASIGGLLMLVGYSIDTDVLTAVRILKRHEGTPEQRAYDSMRTGLTMTATAVVSFGVLFVVSLFAYVPTYYEIAGVVLFGLIADIFTTWLGNASLVLRYKKRKDRKGEN